MPTTVLVIDDAQSIRRLLIAILREASLFEHYLEASNGEEGLEIAKANKVDVVLCDLDMPVLDGFGFLERFRAERNNQSAPVLMLSGTGDAEKKVSALTRGANDYIVKPCHREELRARVRNYLQLKLLQDELIAKSEELARVATIDPLTGIHNRRYFLERANEELVRSRRHGRRLAFMLLDLDHFKQINDTYGHQQGDTVLVEVAQGLRKRLRTNDLLARFGGEEFVVCLLEHNEETAMLVAERLRAWIAGHEVPGLPRPATASIGVVEYPSFSGEKVDEFLHLADQALYRAKAKGRNRVELAAVSA